ncbi:ATP-binding protein [Polycladidibacter hongkongensis]|uniref:ATP-binding protein n=1 Tax=Polycladidibacter hongkongensis TaxID=1647556 RepID=UPI000830F125|nr:ATP-binding protein [Pseudovibrio hongkongensis]
MMFALKSWWRRPAGMASQLIALLLVAMIGAQALSLILLNDERREALFLLARDNAFRRSAVIVRLLETTPPSQHEQMLKAVSSNVTKYSLSRRPQAFRAHDDELSASLSGLLSQLLERPAAVVASVRIDERGYGARRERREHWRDEKSSFFKGKDREHRSKGHRSALEAPEHDPDEYCGADGYGDFDCETPLWRRLKPDEPGLDNKEVQSGDTTRPLRNKQGLERPFPERFYKRLPLARESLDLLRDLERSGGELALSVQLQEGQWLNIRSRFLPPTPPLRTVFLPVIVMALLVSAVVILFVMRITRPLKTLAQAAEKMGRGEAVAPLKTSGPRELQATTFAFNQMQERLQRFIQDQTRMLAAVSHDLRTPITSLRIRAEFIEDDEDREKTIAILEEMQAMVEATLRFARDEAAQETPTQVDLGTLCEALAADYQDMGAAVTAESGDGLVCRCRPVALKRALRNLIDNALRYGGTAKISVSGNEDVLRVVVRDEGPGIPEDKLKVVFEPFVRLEASRNVETGGIGLGLSICRNIVQAHGGTIQLRNSEGGGLEVIIELPI